jgi:hypothetical protein
MLVECHDFCPNATPGSGFGVVGAWHWGDRIHKLSLNALIVRTSLWGLLEPEFVHLVS